MAYLTEPIPGGVAPMPPLTWNTFEEYVNTTVSHFQRVFNNDTLKPGQFSTRDLCTNSYGMRHDMAMPFEIAEHDVVDYLIRMPAAMFFGQGMRTFAVNFLTSNATRRMEFQPWQWCQHDLVLTIPIGDFAFGLKKPNLMNTPSGGPRVLWKSYYRHYRVLLSNLQRIGIAPEYVRYQIVVGEPTYAILCDPIVAFGMALDTWLGVAYRALAIIGVTQFQDVWLYISGCMYMSQCVRQDDRDDILPNYRFVYVCFGFLSKRIFSSVVKWRRWEASFAPVDPALLSICAYLYSGPLLSVMGSTRLVSLFYQLWGIFLPPDRRDQAVEGITATIAVSVLMCLLPLLFPLTLLSTTNNMETAQIQSVALL
ncbi:hypothetical protein AeRB84_015090 [Aphanomyces euteiches]|nr:hypothetical protein AeRB84_015090 [Aphanomyces euteiches]